ncbi:sensor domain-containing diguanylate cyclase [Treponema sp.]|uniref:diguanylate cyclase n=1 Tax=Treponema sp. TaxID=166 RepID=UPI0025DB13C4|nr:sensor domain-containing diguanylate cyclase [Treponema sp.]MCR5217881.1 sensor domain-containing diguanylate cyclase [Treponema sp.]
MSDYTFSKLGTNDYNKINLFFAEHFISQVDKEDYIKNLCFENVKEKVLTKGEFSYRFQRINLQNRIEDLEATALQYDENNFVILFRNVKRRVDNIEASVFRVIYETLGGGIFYFDLTPGGKVKRCLWSAAFRRLLDYSGEEDFSNELGTFLKCIYVEDRIPFIQELKRKLKSKNTVFDFKFRAFTKSNVVHWFRIAGVTTFAIDGSAERFFGSLVDIDFEVKNRKEIERIRDEHAKDFFIMDAISGVYNSMHLVDLKEDFVIEYSSSDSIRSWVKYNNKAYDQMKDAMSHLIAEEYIDGVLAFTDFKTLPVRMKGKKYIAHEMLSINKIWMRAAFILVEKNENEEPVKVLFTTQKIQDEKEKERTLILKSNTDELTGFFNRRAFVEDTEKFKNGMPSDVDLTVVMMDLNGLKYVNDTYGHDTGDKYLKAAARCMKETFGPYGHLYRIGGDEFFAILFADEKLLETIKKDFEEKCFKRTVNENVKVSVSCGFATCREFPDYSFKQLLQTADERMYRAKSDYYAKHGTDKRELQEAFDVLCGTYVNIYRINLTSNTYTVINASSCLTQDVGEYKGFYERMNFVADSDHVHPEDKEAFRKKISPEHLDSFFKDKKRTFCHYYRGKIKDRYVRFSVEIVPAKEYSPDDQICFLYVKEIE